MGSILWVAAMIGAGFATIAVAAGSIMATFTVREHTGKVTSATWFKWAATGAGILTFIVLGAVFGPTYQAVRRIGNVIPGPERPLFGSGSGFIPEGGSHGRRAAESDISRAANRFS
jgi:hypothetical protein